MLIVACIQEDYLAQFPTYHINNSYQSKQLLSSHLRLHHPDRFLRVHHRIPLVLMNEVHTMIIPSNSSSYSSSSYCKASPVNQSMAWGINFSLICSPTS